MNWQKLGESNAAKAVTVVVIGIGAAWAYATWDEPGEGAPEALATSLQVVTSLDGVQLGQTLAQAAAARGPFERHKDGPNVVKKYADEENHWQKNGRLRLAVRAGAVFSIAYPCKDGRDTAAVNHVACHASSERIRSVFGDRLRVLCPILKAGDPNTALAPYARAYDVVEYGTRYIVFRDKVTGFIIAAPAQLASMVGLNWGKCG